MNKVNEIISIIAFLAMAVFTSYWFAAILFHFDERPELEKIGLAIFGVLNMIVIEIVYWRHLWVCRKQS